MFKQRLEESETAGTFSSHTSPRTSMDSQHKAQKSRSNLSKGRRARPHQDLEMSDIYVDVTPPVHEDVIEELAEIPEKSTRSKQSPTTTTMEVTSSRSRRTRSQTSSQNSRARRRRNHSSSSEESDYISHFPTSVFHPTASALHRDIGPHHSGAQTESM